MATRFMTDPHAMRDMAGRFEVHAQTVEDGWITRKNTHGHTEWLPPPHLDHGQPRINTFHHPEKLLRDDDDEPD